MDKKSVDMDKNDNRSELVGKVQIKESSKKKSSNKREVKVDLEQTMALDTVDILRNGNVKSHSEEEKRSEIVGKFGSKKKSKKESGVVASKKVRNRKIRVKNNSMLETNEDRQDENVENFSLAMIAMLVVFCLVVCFVIGYMLYKIALTNSDTMAVIFRGFGF